LSVLAIAAAGPAGAQQTVHDIVIRNGRLLDGTGNPWYYADVAVEGDRVVAVGDLSQARGRRTIDASGLYIAPGFIDAHSHAGPGLETPELSHGRPLLAQGITTVFVNPDGGGPSDLARQRQDLLADGLGVNVALLVPHGSLRRAVLGMQDRDATSDELARMVALVRRGMDEGAFGLSSGLYYAPGSYAKTEEVIELAKIAAAYGGVYTSHIRDEADYNVGVVAAVDEVIRIAREAQLPGVVTHIKALGPRVWGYSQALVYRIERARASGIEVWADQYPYEASATGLTAALVPRWAQVGGNSALLERVADPTVRARLRSEMLENLDRRGGASRLQFRRHEADPSIEGRTLEAVAVERGMEPVDVAIALVEAGGAGVVSFNMNDGDVEILMRQPWTMTASDGDLVPMGEGVPHPRSYGTFPRKIRGYVLERPVVDLAAAVRSMTFLPASVFRMRDRGLVQPGVGADLVVFDLARLEDKATYRQPHQLAEGMVFVLVNGELAVDGGEFTGRLVGRVLER
jgi:N-acyl-D-aspartate/D-glutamate deacylase